MTEYDDNDPDFRRNWGLSDDEGDFSSGESEKSDVEGEGETSE